MGVLKMVTLLIAMATFAVTAAATRPHIVFIIADDLGWDDVGFHGSEITTPNIDALAYSGIILNNYYVSPICSPTRSAIMTGRHPIHTGMHVGVIGGATPYGLPLNETIMPQYLEKLGYRRHIVGKWHLGFFEDSYLPLRRGFESHVGYFTGHEDYFDHEAQDSGFYGLDMHRNEETIWTANGNFSTEMYSYEAEKIITSHNKSESLFLYLAHQAVHAGNGPNPLQVPQKYIDRFKDKIHNVQRRIFAGMVSALDDSVGRVVQALKDSGLYDNTIIVFTTDNGGPTNGYDGNAACNWPLRGVKNTMWEGGVRGVGFINSPLLGSTSYISNNFFHVTDWLPTLYRAAGGDPATLLKLDGFDMLDMLKNKGPPVRKEVLHNIDPVNHFAAIRVGDYKLVQGHVSNQDNSWYPPPKVFEANKEKIAFLKFESQGHLYSSSLDFEKRNQHQHAEALVNRWNIPTSNKNELLFLQQDNAQNGNNEYYPPLKGDSSSVLKDHEQNSHISPNPIIVDCGKMPTNASTNCKPETLPCLFYIPSDPCEYLNIADKYPEIVKQLLARLEEYRSTMVPPQNKPVDPKGNPALHGGVWKPWM